MPCAFALASAKEVRASLEVSPTLDLSGGVTLVAAKSPPIATLLLKLSSERIVRLAPLLQRLTADKPVPSKPETSEKGDGGAGGIRTLDTGLPYTHFPGVRLRPLGHCSVSLFALPLRCFSAGGLVGPRASSGKRACAQQPWPASPDPKCDEPLEPGRAGAH